MTPPEHFLLGITCANIFYSFLGIFRKNWYTYLKLALVMGLVAVSPDVDSFFGHYISQDPYVGHRGMTHSLIGVAVLALIAVFFVSLFSIVLRAVIGYWKFLVRFFKKKFGAVESPEVIWKYVVGPFFPKQFLVFFVFAFIAGVSHLISDLPQPPSVWKGIPLFFPLKENGVFVRNGGWNLIGWYDIKILWVLIGACISTIPLVILSRLLSLIKLKYVKYIFIPFFSLIIIFNTGVLGWIANYVMHSRYEGEAKWYEGQMKIVDVLPPDIKNATLKGKTIFISLFRQVQGGK